ncbi:MAG: hypothetical protein GX967_02960 [Clostridiales bacterium]|nr:hypothetical protein [Clostridiales bacterium]
MPKDSQPDNKKARKEKANHQTPITRENQQKIRTQKENQSRITMFNHRRILWLRKA